MNVNRRCNSWRQKYERECESKSGTRKNMGDRTISQSLTQYLSNIPGNHEIKELKKQPYWALHTYCGKCYCKGTKHISRAK